MKLSVSEAAARDIAKIAIWYEGRERDLGERFLDAVDAFLEGLEEHPLRYRIAHGPWRRALMPRFPYCIFYRVMADEVFVIGVFHGRRDPWAWMQRIE